MDYPVATYDFIMYDLMRVTRTMSLLTGRQSKKLLGCFHHPPDAFRHAEVGTIHVPATFLVNFWSTKRSSVSLARWTTGNMQPSPAAVAVLTKRCRRKESNSTDCHSMHHEHCNCKCPFLCQETRRDNRGKLHYLFAQMKRFGLNVIGLQECRSDEGHTTSNNILRYMSGHRQGQEGVEIWINLDQPIATTEEGKPCYLAAHHCLVTWKDPRTPSTAGCLTLIWMDGSLPRMPHTAASPEMKEKLGGWR